MKARPFPTPPGRVAALALVLLFAFAAASGATVAAGAKPAGTTLPDTIRVGLYENPPKIFTGPDGRAAGFFAEVLDEIARREGWRLEYVPGSWTECLERLSRRELEIMVDVAWSEERAEPFEFNKENLLTNWGRVYAARPGEIYSLLDLRGKRVATMKGSIHTNGPEGIISLSRRYDLGCVIVEADGYREVFELLERGAADAGIVNRIFGIQSEESYAVHRTPVVINPANLLFAFPRGRSINPILIDRIDARVREMKQNPGSPYYQAIERHLKEVQLRGAETGQEWAWTALLVLAVAVISSLAGALLSRRSTAQAGRELAEENARLIAHRDRIAQELDEIGAPLEQAGRALDRIADHPSAGPGSDLHPLLAIARRNMNEMAERIARLEQDAADRGSGAPKGGQR